MIEGPLIWEGLQRIFSTEFNEAYKMNFIKKGDGEMTVNDTLESNEESLQSVQRNIDSSQEPLTPAMVALTKKMLVEAGPHIRPIKVDGVDWWVEFSDQYKFDDATLAEMEKFIEANKGLVVFNRINKPELSKHSPSHVVFYHRYEPGSSERKEYALVCEEVDESMVPNYAVMRHDGVGSMHASGRVAYARAELLIDNQNAAMKTFLRSQYKTPKCACGEMMSVVWHDTQAYWECGHK